MRPWPQIGLIPRDPTRADLFENVFFIGNACNLQKDLSSKAFRERLASIGLTLQVQPPERWHDFSEVDAVLAIREFGRPSGGLSRPSIKLYNAWLAGAPIVVGHEPGCQAEGRPGIDYLEAISADEAFEALQQLAGSPDKRRAIVQAGRERAAMVSVAQIRHDWLRLIDETLLPAYRQWLDKPAWTQLVEPVMGAVRERLLWRRPSWFSSANAPRKVAAS